MSGIKENWFKITLFNLNIFHQIYVNLLTESDCMKWLADFEEKTNTDWRVDKEASRIISQTNKV